jgi:hypothetical protein
VTKLVEDATATYAKDQSAAINQLLDAWQLILDGASSAYIADIQTTPVATEKLEGFEGFSPLEYMCINIYDLALRK